MSNNHEFFLNKDPFASRIPKNLGLCPLKVSTLHFPPFVIYPEDGEATLLSMGGLDIYVLRHVSEAMNFSVVLRPTVYNDTHSETEKESWTQILADLLCNRSDIAVGAWSYTSNTIAVVDGTDRYFADAFTWFIPRAGTYPRFLSISRVFSPGVWLLVFAVMLVAAVLFYRVAVTQTAGESNSYKSFINSLLNTWSVVLGVSVHEKPRSDLLRGIFCLWLMHSLAINTVFQTYVTTYLVDPGRRHQIDSEEEIIESGSEVYVPDVLQDLLSNNLLNQLKSWRNCGSGSQCLIAASRSPGAVMLSGRVFVAYNAAKQSDAFLYHESSRELFHFHIAMVLRKGSPFLDRINTVIRRLVEGGFPIKFYKDIVLKKNLKSLPEHTNECVPMSVPHLHSAFVAMFSGMSLSLLLFVGELLIKRTQRSQGTN
jgi:ABC-type amino acid transport substrate-binding protein